MHKSFNGKMSHDNKTVYKTCGNRSGRWKKLTRA